MAVEKINNRLLVHFPLSKINIFGAKTFCNNIAEIKCCVRLFNNEKLKNYPGSRKVFSTKAWWSFF